MIEILNLPDSNIIGFSLDGNMNATDIKRAFEALNPQLKGRGKLRIYAEVKNFGPKDYTMEAMLEEFKEWLTNPNVVTKVEKMVVVTDAPWIRTAFAVECGLIPTMTGASFTPDEKGEALAWLRSDATTESRLEFPGRVDLTLPQLVGYGTVKAVGGFALGLFAAGLWNAQKRTKIGWAVLLGAVVAGVPLAFRVLKRNADR